MKFEIDKTYYSLDWIHGVCQTNCVGSLFQALVEADPRLDFQNFALFSKGIYNYSTRYGLYNKSFITVGYNPAEDPSLLDQVDDWGMYATSEGFNTGVFVSITGDGIRFLGSEGTLNVMKVLYNFGFRCSRLDVACDVFDPENPYVPHLDEAFLHCCSLDEVGQLTVKSDMTRRHLKAFLNRDSHRNGKYGDFTRSWTWGHSGSSRCMFRMYDKWLEMKDGRLSEYDTQLDDLPSDYWYRFEYEMHKTYAATLFNMIVEGECNVPAAFAYCADRCFYPVYNSLTSVTQQDFSRGDNSDVWQYFISLASDYVIEPTFDFVQLEFSEERRISYFKHMSPLFYSFLVTMRHCQDLEAHIYDDGARRFYKNKANIPLINKLGGLSEERFLHTHKYHQSEFVADDHPYTQLTVSDEAYNFLTHTLSSEDLFTPLSDGSIQLVMENI